MGTGSLRARAAIVAGLLALGACNADRITTPTSTSTVHAPSRAVTAATLDVPALPRETVDVTPVAPTGRTIAVRSGGSVQSAINAAEPGDVIELQAGATFTGNFYLPKKTGSGWITIRSSAPDYRLPEPGERFEYSQVRYLPKIVSPNGSAALRTRSGAHHYRIIGVEITAKSSLRSATALVAIGTGSTTHQRTLASVPHHIVIDRSYIHGRSTLNLKNCVEIHGAHVAIVDSYLSRCHSRLQESHAIIGWNGPGPILIENNYIAGGHINIMFGGATPASSDLVPSDIVIRRNHVRKWESWDGVWPVKNLLELKIGRRILIEGNVFENSWVDAQTGFAFVFKTAVSSRAATWGRTEDVTVRKNLIRNAAGGVSISARDGSSGLASRRYRFEHNVWDGIGASNGTTMGRIFQVLDGVNEVQIEHNTAIHAPRGAQMFVTFGSGTVGDFVFRDNLVTRGYYGLKGDGTAEGSDALAQRTDGYSFTNNVIVGARASAYPASNHFPSSLSSVRFVSLSRRDYRLSSTSPYKGTASDGTDPGADVAAVMALTAGVVR